ncbi:hypothetical protein SANTM175S_06183 [Streptomyces antimycoticus]
MAAYADLLARQPEGDGLNGERFVDAGGEVERADDDVFGFRGSAPPARCSMGGTLLGRSIRTAHS